MKPESLRPLIRFVLEEIALSELESPYKYAQQYGKTLYDLKNAFQTKGITSKNELIKIASKTCKDVAIARKLVKIWMAHYGMVDGQQVDDKLWRRVSSMEEGNDMASMDVGQGSPSGRMWENGVTDSGITSKDFVALAFFVKSLDKEWKNVLAYSKTKPEAASDSLNNVYKLVEDIKRKADEIKLNLEPYLK